MKQENWYDVDSLRNKDYAMSTAFPALMRKVFVWMTLALAITGLTAYGVATSPTILSLIFSSKVTFFGLIIAEFALVFAISGAINRLSLSTATMLFILYSVINGATLSSIFFAFSVATISKVFLYKNRHFIEKFLIGFIQSRWCYMLRFLHYPLRDICLKFSSKFAQLLCTLHQ